MYSLFVWGFIDNINLHIELLYILQVFAAETSELLNAVKYK